MNGIDRLFNRMFEKYERNRKKDRFAGVQLSRDKARLEFDEGIRQIPDGDRPRFLSQLWQNLTDT